MIVYEISNWWGIRDLPRIHGSALYKSIVPATLSTALLIVAEWTSSWDGGANQRIIAHPYSVGALIAFFSILLTFHLNYAYTRYWEACTTVHHMVSKWLDCATTLAAFHYQAQAFDDIRPPTYGEHPDLMRKQVAGGPHQRSFCLSYDETMLMIDQHLQVDSAASSVHPNQDTKGVASTTTTMTWWQKLRRKSSSSSSTPEQHSERAARKKNINVSRHDDSEGAVAAKQIPIPLRFQEQFSLATAHHSSRRLQRRSGLVKQSRAFLHLNRQREAKIPKPSLFLQDSAHLFSLLSAVAMATLRNDDPHAEFPLTEYIPGKPWPPVDPDQLSVDVRREYGHHSLLQRLVHFFLGLEHSQMQRTLYNAARPFPVLGGVSDMEIESLGEAVGPSAKVSMASLWLEEFVSREILSGSTGNIPAPLLSNLYQYVSDGLAAFHQARKLSQVPSPFPHTQITAFFSFIIIFLFPVLFYDFATNLAFVSVLNFVTVMCFHGTILFCVVLSVCGGCVNSPSIVVCGQRHNERPLTPHTLLLLTDAVRHARSGTCPRRTVHPISQRFAARDFPSSIQ